MGVYVLCPVWLGTTMHVYCSTVQYVVYNIRKGGREGTYGGVGWGREGGSKATKIQLWGS